MVGPQFSSKGLKSQDTSLSLEQRLGNENQAMLKKILREINRKSDRNIATLESVRKASSREETVAKMALVLRERFPDAPIEAAIEIGNLEKARELDIKGKKPAEEDGDDDESKPSTSTEQPRDEQGRFISSSDDDETKPSTSTEQPTDDIPATSSEAVVVQGEADEADPDNETPGGVSYTLSDPINRDLAYFASFIRRDNDWSRFGYTCVC